MPIIENVVFRYTADFSQYDAQMSRRQTAQQRRQRLEQEILGRTGQQPDQQILDAAQRAQDRRLARMVRNTNRVMRRYALQTDPELARFDYHSSGPRQGQLRSRLDRERVQRRQEAIRLRRENPELMTARQLKETLKQIEDEYTQKTAAARRKAAKERLTRMQRAEKEAARIDPEREYQMRKRRADRLLAKGRISKEAHAEELKKAYAKTPAGRKAAEDAKAAAKATKEAEAAQKKYNAQLAKTRAKAAAAFKRTVIRAVLSPLRMVRWAVMRIVRGFTHFGVGMTTALGRLRYGLSALRVALDPIRSLLRATVGSAVSFNEAMVQATAIMDNADAKFVELSEHALDLSTTVRQDAVQLAKTYYSLGSAGLDAASSMKALPVAAKFATVAMMETNEATRLLMQTQRAMGLEGKTATENMNNMLHVANVLTKAETLAQGTLRELTTSLAHDAAASARVAGYSLEEVTASITALSNRGMSGALAGNLIGRMLRLLNQAAEGNAAVFKKLKVEVFDTNNNMKKLPDIFRDLEKAMSKLNSRGVTAAFKNMGFRVLSQKAISQFLGSADVIEQHLKKLMNSADSLEGMYKKHMNAFAAQADLTKNKLNVIGIEMANQFLPFMLRVVKAVGHAAMWFRKLDPILRDVSITVMTVTAALTAMATVMTVMLTVASFLFGPAGMLVMGLSVASLAFGIWAGKAVKDAGGITNALKNVGDWLTDLWNKTERTRYAFSEAFEKAYTAVEKFVVNAMKATGRWISSFTGKTFDSMEDFDKAMTMAVLSVEWATGKMPELWDLALNSMVTASLRFGTNLGKMLGGVTSYWDSLPDRIQILFMRMAMQLPVMMLQSLRALGNILWNFWAMQRDMAWKAINPMYFGSPMKSAGKAWDAFVKESRKDITNSFKDSFKDYGIILGADPKLLNQSTEKLLEKLDADFKAKSGKLGEDWSKHLNDRMKEIDDRIAADKDWDAISKIFDDEYEKAIKGSFKRPADAVRKGGEDYVAAVNETKQRMQAAEFGSLEAEERIDKYLETLGMVRNIANDPNYADKIGRFGKNKQQFPHSGYWWNLQLGAMRNRGVGPQAPPNWKPTVPWPGMSPQVISKSQGPGPVPMKANLPGPAFGSMAHLKSVADRAHDKTLELLGKLVDLGEEQLRGLLEYLRGKDSDGGGILP